MCVCVCAENSAAQIELMETNSEEETEPILNE